MSDISSGFQDAYAVVTFTVAHFFWQGLEANPGLEFHISSISAVLQ